MSNDKKAAKPKTKTYTLKNAVSVNGKLLSPGDKIDLTEEAAKDFKFKHRI